MDWGQLIGSVLVTIVVPLTSMWVVSRIRKPKDWERAQEYKQIAQAAAALVLAMNPSASWAQLLKLIIDALAGKIQSPEIRERLAAEALLYWQTQGKVIPAAPKVPAK